MTPEALRTRERALLATLNGLPVRTMRGAHVVLLDESLPPLVTPWGAVPAGLRILGIELHPDVVARVETLLGAGCLPALTFIGGWVTVHEVSILPLSPGGVA